MKLDLYGVLGLKKSDKPSQDDIRKAYRKLALEYHPDKYVNNEKERKKASEKMAKINEAYNILGKEESRKKYDRSLENPFADSFNSSNFSSSQWGSNMGGFDFFESFFGDSGSWGSGSSQKTEFEKDIIVSLQLTFKESILGATKKINLQVKKACSTCDQTGAFSSEFLVNCKQCNGRGLVDQLKRTFFGVIRTKSTCSSCKGAGKTVTKKCLKCHGEKFIQEEEIVEIEIPRTIPFDKEQKVQLKVPGKGHEGFANSARGDLFIVLTVKKNDIFERKGVNIYVDLPLSFLDAILGAEKDVLTLEGVKKISIPACSKEGDLISFAGHGCYQENGFRGNFYARLRIRFPEKISLVTREMLEKILSQTKWDPNRDFIEKNKEKINY